MDNLILRTRLDILKTNLERVKEVDSVEELRADLQTLLDLPTDKRIIGPVRHLSQLVENAKESLFDKDPDQILLYLEDMAVELQAVRDVLRETEGAVGKIRLRALPIRRGKAWPALQDGLVSKAEVQIGALQAIDDGYLERAVTLAGDGDQAGSRAQARQAWHEYSTSAYRDSHTVFAEYLDFLSGLALRDTGFDRGICRIADELIRTCGRLPESFTWESLTIPAQNEALRATMAKIVRLGFPEWTVWALPLAVHEFGHVAASLRTIEDFIKGHASTEAARHRLRICLADAFATFVLGPAYACAVILIRLDPVTAFAVEDKRLNEKRARVVLAMLEHMNQPTAPTEPTPYDDVTTRLRYAWEEATGQAEGGGPALSLQEQADIGEWVDLISTTMGLHRALPTHAWPRVEELAADLTPDRVAGITVQLEDEPRLVLNAAWKRRLEEDDFQKVDQIAMAAFELCERLVAMSQASADDQWPSLSDAKLRRSRARPPRPDSSGSGTRGNPP